MVPREVQGIHHTQEEINTLTAILTLRETQWRQIQVVMETQKDKQKGGKWFQRVWCIWGGLCRREKVVVNSMDSFLLVY